MNGQDSKAPILRDGETLCEVNDGIRLIQDPKGLTFGTDAFLLSAFVRRSPRAVAAEYGSGSGIISLLLASRGKLGRIFALEAQEYYAELTERNAHLNGLSEKVTAMHCDVRELLCEYDIIFSNPPYMKTDSGKRNLDDGKFAARHEVLGGIADFCASAAKNLKFGGLFYCVYRPDRAVDLICAMREHGIEPKRICFVHADTLHQPCLMLVEGKRGASPSCDLMPPLFLYNDKTTVLTDRAQKIYDTGDWI